MVKYYCDKCGKETSPDELKVVSIEKTVETLGEVTMEKFMRNMEICPACAEALKQYLQN